MTTMRFAPPAVVLFLIGACADAGRDSSMLTDPTLSVREGSAVTAHSAARVHVSGDYVALVDFSTLTLTPRGTNCLLEVDGQLVFTGTIQGTATGRTSALVFAPCADVASNPPGTFGDTFKSEATFEGAIDGEPARAHLRYVGRVHPGGAISARLIFSGGVSGSLETHNAVVAVGGDYSGNVVVTH